MLESWRKIVKVEKGYQEEALRTLAEEVGLSGTAFLPCLNEVCLQGAEYITAVPVDIALTADERETIMKCSPNVKFVVTRIQEDRVASLLDLGYSLIEPKPTYGEDCESVDIIDSKLRYQVGGKTVSGQEIYDAFEEDPLVPRHEERSEEPKDQEYDDEKCTCSDKVQKCVSKTKSYKVNGKEVSEEEFDKELEKAGTLIHKIFSHLF